VRERGKLREVVIEGQQYFAVVRLAGMRKAFPISYATIYETAAKIAADRKRAEARESKTRLRSPLRKRR